MLCPTWKTGSKFEKTENHICWFEKQYDLKPEKHTKNREEKIHQWTSLWSQLSTFVQKTLNQTQNRDPRDQNRSQFHFFVNCHRPASNMVYKSSLKQIF